jgi:hypothetical protein
MRFTARLGAAMAAVMSLALSTDVLAHPPDEPHKEWLESVQRPDNHLHPQRKLDPKSLYCCGAADIVKTKFKVENGGDRYPEDVWYAWLDNEWAKIPPEKIVKDHAPDEQAHLFVVAGTIQCFIRPKGGL